jgi:hypothetical protein
MHISSAGRAFVQTPEFELYLAALAHDSTCSGEGRSKTEHSLIRASAWALTGRTDEMPTDQIPTVDEFIQEHPLEMAIFVARAAKVMAETG